MTQSEGPDAIHTIEKRHSAGRTVTWPIQTLFALCACLLLMAAPKHQKRELEVALPPASRSDKPVLKCKALLSTDMVADSAGKLSGSVGPTPEEWGVTVKGRSVLLAKTGRTDLPPQQFQILRSSADYLIAVFVETWPGGTVDTFVLNKKNGLAIWTRSTATWPPQPLDTLAGVEDRKPYTNALYLACK